jgi:succinate dehydrogenase/fumarate reductase flavoprotein subunit
MVHDTDDAGVNRRFHGVEGKAGFFAAYEEDGLPHAGANRIGGNQRPSD